MRVNSQLYSDCHGPETWDETLGVYVAYCQAPCFNGALPGKGDWPKELCEGSPPAHAPGQRCSGEYLSADIRRIGRCVSADLYEWDCNPNTTTLVMSFDQEDPVSSHGSIGCWLCQTFPGQALHVSHHAPLHRCGFPALLALSTADAVLAASLVWTSTRRRLSA